MDSFWTGFEKRASLIGMLGAQGKRLVNAARGTQSVATGLGGRATASPLVKKTFGQRMGDVGTVLGQTGRGLMGAARKGMTGSAKPLAAGAAPGGMMGAMARNPGKTLAGGLAAGGALGYAAGNSQSQQPQM